MVNLIEIANHLASLNEFAKPNAGRFAGVLLQEHWIEYRATAESLENGLKCG